MRPTRRVPRATKQTKGRSSSNRTRQPSLRELYLKSCAENGLLPNSVIVDLFPDKPGVPFPLEVIDIRSNYLGDRGILPLLATVDHMANLRALVLSQNGIRNKGVEALANCLSRHPTVEYVDISDNYISEGAARSLERLLRCNHRIVDVVIENTKIDVGWRVKLKDLMKANRCSMEQQAALADTAPSTIPGSS